MADPGNPLDSVGASHQQLSRAAGICEEAAQYIEGMRKRVVTINVDLKNAWKGNAARSFGSALDQWDTDFKGVIKILHDIYERLEKGGGVYGSAENHTWEIAKLNGDGSAGRIDDLINAKH